MVNDIQTVVPIHTATILKEIYEWSYYIKESTLNIEGDVIIVKNGLRERYYGNLFTRNNHPIVKRPLLKKTVSLFYGDIHTYPLREGEVVKLPSGEQLKIKSVVIGVNGAYEYTITDHEILEPDELDLKLESWKHNQRLAIQEKLDKLNWWQSLFNDYRIEEWREREYD